MKNFSLIILLIITHCALAQTKQTITKADITFSIKNLGITTGGSIGSVQADIIFDKNKPESSSIQGSADVNTINTDNDSRDNHLKSEDYFDATKYPKMTMRSVSIKHKSGNNYTAKFNVTIKDKTKLIDVPFTYTVNGTTAEYKGSFKILRTDFGIGDKGLVLGNEVTVFIDIQTTQ
jgi:polyisoprenoid-binding protein YceI